MRVGDFGVEIVAVRDGEVREIESGHVLARPGTVYGIRLRNLGPLRCVAQVSVDGKDVTERGLVIDAYAVMTLERPVTGIDSGRFTVIAEGDERVFGPDGGRDNPELGLIEVRFRRELPREHARHVPDLVAAPPIPRPIEPAIPTPPGRPMAPPEWTPPGIRASASRPRDISAIASKLYVTEPTHVFERDLVERAAGTGLTGASTQQFVPVSIGPLEKEATVIRLRLVIGTDEAFAEARPLPEPDEIPARPPARP